MTNEYRWKEFFSILKSCLITVAVVFILFKVLFSLSFVPSESMVPTIEPGKMIIGWHLPYLISDPKPQKGDIITFKRDGLDKLYVKRIIGTEGDNICIEEGLLYINGERAEESYLKEPLMDCEDMEFTVPYGCFFAMGDNRNDSNDSRFWDEHFVPIENIESKVIFIFQ